MSSTNRHIEQRSWYALRVFNNKVLQMQETILREAEEAAEFSNVKDSFVVETYVAMTSSKKTVSTSKPSRSANLSYSGNKLTDITKTKRAIINDSNKPSRTVTVKKPLVASLLFLRCTESFLKSLKHNHLSEFSYYTRYANKETDRETENPRKQLEKVLAIIPDDQMQAFIWLTSEDNDVTYLGEPKDIKLGDKVKVIDGPFKGLEGHVKRIKKDRKFVLSIGNIAAFVIEGISHKDITLCSNS
ncbi:MAG: KOW motif-containing protein [Bacteroidales bacterium]|nr:KOW motif-containing protein [Bacteroidales bacterium]